MLLISTAPDMIYHSIKGGRKSIRVSDLIRFFIWIYIFRIHSAYTDATVQIPWTVTGRGLQKQKKIPYPVQDLFFYMILLPSIPHTCSGVTITSIRWSQGSQGTASII